MVLRNAISLGYPFVEAITQIVNVVDEFVVLEGCSNDGTVDILKKLSKKYNNKVRIIEEPWGQIQQGGTVIGEAQTRAIRYCRGDYVFLVQGDELWHEKSISIIPELSNISSNRDLFLFDFNHIFNNLQLKVKHSGYPRAVRFAKNFPGLYSLGDGWTLKGSENGAYVPLPVPICHTGPIGYRKVWQKYINHGQIYSGLEAYQQSAEFGRKGLAGEIDPPEDYFKTSTPYKDEVPSIIWPLIGVSEYYIRPELLE